MNIIVVVKDSATKQPLSKATAVIISKRDSVLVDFGITDSLGKYHFKNVNSEKAGFVVASVTGYLDKKIPLAMPVKTGNTKLADITIDVMLSPNFVVLDDVVVMGKVSPIKMNKDTLEFDADFFKSHPNAVLEDLLRKLPGVEVREGNEVYVNGQRVSKIMVDGKEFFSSDPVIILKNLPAEIIAKVQVVDEKNTIAKETREQKDIPKIINIKLKKEVKSGMFGKFFAGHGTDGRYEAGGILNVFRDTLQLSFIGSSNNQGRGGFSMQDLNDLGGFGRSGDVGGQSARGLANRNSQGIETKNLAGVNINYNIGKDVQLNGQYFYNHTDRRTGYETETQQFLGDSVLLTNMRSTGMYGDDSHKMSAGLKWKQDSTGYLTVHINSDFSSNTQQGESDSKRFSANAPLLSGSSGNNSNKGNRSNIYSDISYSKTFVPLRLDWSLNGGFSNSESDQVSATDNRYIRIITNFLPDSLRQLRKYHTPVRRFNISNNFSKNWKDKNSISWRAEYTNSKDVTGGNTYQYSKLTGKDELMPGLSVQLMQHKQRLNNQVTYRYSDKKITIQTGISMRNLAIENSYNYDTIPVINRKYNLVTPVIEINFKGISFNYSRSLQEPYAGSLRPVTDSSNPFYITSGNPNLKPAKSSDYSLGYYKYFDRSKLNFNIWSNINTVKDAIGNSRQVFPDGKTVEGYINLKRVTNYNLSLNVNKSYNKNNWNYNTSFNAGLYNSASPLMLNGKIINTVTTTIYPSMSASVGYKNKFRLQAGYRVNFNQSKSDDSTLRTANTSQHTVYSTLHVQIFRRLSWDANINYNINPGTPAGYKRQWLFCDMALTCSFLKKDRAQVKLSGFDIFNQNEGIYRYAYQNYLTDNKSLVQKQYFMLTLLYTVRKF